LQRGRVREIEIERERESDKHTKPGRKREIDTGEKKREGER
jgi:hypothetical protein